MPLIKEIIEDNYRVLIWRVEENLDNLREGVVLREATKERFSKMKSEVHQKGFMAVRHLLSAAGYSDLDLCYDENGKPSLVDGSHISISHSFEYASIIIGTENVGIDVEMKRDKIKRIANKFCNTIELELATNAQNEIEVLTEVWCAKEAMFKMCESRSLSFKDDMNVLTGEKRAIVNNEIFKQLFEYKLIDLGNFVLVYALESKS
ncbi:4'-phosphopantetheinyl transferase superfamily protein [Myroides marinus]|uniref:4'-phosphopantetheinyl transferase superfamily protein n=1 Tax=Myroides marinus TaxID=703342 RepID=A0A1H6RIR7_9FLAO|nr:4'-phosphopantetheinyl transferase superfamily protein [Myroides marinus]MDM1345526.1 4'-phosphopantetheinyl transferase superfamily protein [Myroides marinus]MDM1349115.1 4'-phosphopantetheinyl transferase superfamily protein [Myroides marinus]MDM1352761.1 4'-phosphopantetheinyl transferase superfamily protein [Myroides marinus]MDM1356325.1 4'-phosphopantetheinyl transferase superfamily protein [Myroides marinus]MDM1360011.1 4'-phosphopantetheinyl transferase superfamily protein [Myroides 